MNMDVERQLGSVAEAAAATWSALGHATTGVASTIPKTNCTRNPNQNHNVSAHSLGKYGREGEREHRCVCVCVCTRPYLFHFYATLRFVGIFCRLTVRLFVEFAASRDGFLALSHTLSLSLSALLSFRVPACLLDFTSFSATSSRYAVTKEGFKSHSALRCFA